MIENLYARYLVADHLSKLADTAGVTIDVLSIKDIGDSHDIHVQVSAHNRKEGEVENAADRAAERLLVADPTLTLIRSDGLVFLKGTSHGGIRFRFYSGSGACERVQVGTKIIPAEPERVIPAQPEREEPIFEVRCPDPINELLGV